MLSDSELSAVKKIGSLPFTVGSNNIFKFLIIIIP